MLKNLFKKFSDPEVMQTGVFADADWLGHYSSYRAIKNAWTGKWDMFMCTYVSPSHPHEYKSIMNSKDSILDYTPVFLPELRGEGVDTFHAAQHKKKIESFKTKEDAIAFMREREDHDFSTGGRMQEKALSKMTVPVKTYYLCP